MTARSTTVTRGGPCKRQGLRSSQALGQPSLALPHRHAENELPHPHPPVAFGLLNVNPEPCIEET